MAYKEEFVKQLHYDDSSDRSLLEKIADAHDKLHPALKAFKNLNPLVGAFCDVLAENKERRDEARLEEILYQYYIVIQVLTECVNKNKIDVEYIKQQLPALSEVYLDHSMKTYQLEKIEYFRNILINGPADYKSEFDEKINIFDIIESLTIREIRILEYVHNRSFKLGTMMKIEELIAAFVDPSIDAVYLAQLCHNLVGKGLLSRVSDYGKYDAQGITIGYKKAGYTDRLIEYIKDYSK